MIPGMIRFSQRLKEVLDTTGWKQKDLADRASVSPTNVSRWLGCSALPDRQALGRLVDALPEHLASDVVTAWIWDSLPPNAEGTIRILPRTEGTKVREDPDAWPPELNQSSRRKFIDFAKLASQNKDVMEVVAEKRS